MKEADRWQKIILPSVGIFEGDEATLRKRLGEDPSDQQARKALAQEQLRRGHHGEAELLLRDLLFEAPGDRDAIFLLAQIALGKSQVARSGGLMDLWVLAVCDAGTYTRADFAIARAYAFSLLDLDHRDEAHRFASFLRLLDSDGWSAALLKAELLLRGGQADAAAKIFGNLKAHKPDSRSPYVGLYGCIRTKGPSGRAAELLQEYFRRFPTFHVPARQSPPAASVLVLDGYYLPGEQPRTIGDGIDAYLRYNTISQIFPFANRRIAYTALMVDHPEIERVAAAITGYDIVFNNVANSDAFSRNRLLECSKRAISALGKPVLNQPAQVASTSRQANYLRFQDATDFVFPRTETHRIRPEDASAAASDLAERFAFPVILRAAEMHHGVGVVLVGNRQELAEAIEKAGGEPIYAIQHFDFVSADGLYRKYRMVCIGDRLLPVRIDFGTKWMVHRSDEGETMLKERAALRDEERAFLSNPPTYLGGSHIDALRFVARTIGLDFLGIDFAVDRRGRLIVFEANAAMSVLDPDRNKAYGYFRDAGRRLIFSFEDMLINRAERGA